MQKAFFQKFIRAKLSFGKVLYRSFKVMNWCQNFFFFINNLFIYRNNQLFVWSRPWLGVVPADAGVRTGARVPCPLHGAPPQGIPAENVKWHVSLVFICLNDAARGAIHAARGGMVGGGGTIALPCPPPPALFLNIFYLFFFFLRFLGVFFFTSFFICFLS